MITGLQDEGFCSSCPHASLSRQESVIIRASAPRAANMHPFPSFPQGDALGYRAMQTYGLRTPSTF
ncbi:MAG: hypothetical protein J6X16_04925 [Bacteroidales bacterium]|nr:hypothetical protein [Bacteroidales bacterium]